jgi:hypothetical protein
MSLYRAEKLIDLACSTTHDEEARTAALAACRLIRKHGLRLTAAPHNSEARRVHREPAQPRPRRQPEPVRASPPPSRGIWAKATRAGRCEGCGTRFTTGDDVYVVADVAWCARH